MSLYQRTDSRQKTQRIAVSALGLTAVSSFAFPRIYPAVKRGIDIFLSFFGLVFSFPVWIIIAMAIELDSPGPLLYYKECRTINGQVFKQFKFRSMVPNAERKIGLGPPEENKKYVTRIGKFLRKTALDELPQLLNILKGDMSFVGPRPLRQNLIESYLKEIPHFDNRHRVRPGLTGLSQVYGGGYRPDPKKRLRYDLFYARHYNFLLDVKLLLLSFFITFKGKWDSQARKR